MTLHDNYQAEVAVFTPAHPIGTIQILHGMAEHYERYLQLAEVFENAGYKVILHNHQGHGKFKPEMHGHFDSLDQLVSHAYEIFESLCITDQPKILLGHSMGSVISRQYISAYPDLFDALILSGTAYYDYKHRAARAALKSLMLRKGKDAKLTSINDLTLKQFNRRIKPLKTDSDWLSYNEENVRSFIDDPNTGFLMSLNALYEIMNGLKQSQQRRYLKHWNKEMPILLVSGMEDAFGEYGKGIKKLGQLYKKYGMKHVTVQLYSGSRHEVMFEENKDEVAERLLNWIKRNVAHDK